MRKLVKAYFTYLRALPFVNIFVSLDMSELYGGNPLSLGVFEIPNTKVLMRFRPFYIFIDARGLVPQASL